jgi:hypothetical protein
MYKSGKHKGKVNKDAVKARKKKIDNWQKQVTKYKKNASQGAGWMTSGKSRRDETEARISEIGYDFREKRNARNLVEQERADLTGTAQKELDDFKAGQSDGGRIQKVEESVDRAEMGSVGVPIQRFLSIGPSTHLILRDPVAKELAEDVRSSPAGGAALEVVDRHRHALLGEEIEPGALVEGHVVHERSVHVEDEAATTQPEVSSVRE